MRGIACVFLLLQLSVIISGRKAPHCKGHKHSSELESGEQVQTCGKYEVYSANAPLCEAQCNIMFKCMEGYEAKCVCEEGYIRNSDRECVLVSDCPPPPEPTEPTKTCWGENETYFTCNTPYECTPSCFQREIATSCSKMCAEGCYCTSGFLRDGSGVCVPEEECSLTMPCAGQNEIMKTSCLAEACTPTCDDRKMTVRCAEYCRGGCFCQDGYIRDNTGTCVLEEECPQTSVDCVGDHKEYSSCATPAGCVQTCENPSSIGACVAMCSLGCQCESGYLINAQGNCIKKEECPQTVSCGDHQVYNSCGPLDSCLPTCENPNQELTFCPAVCKEGCYCEEGYLKNAEGNCIESAQCTADNNTSGSDNTSADADNDSGDSNDSGSADSTSGGSDSEE